MKRKLWLLSFSVGVMLVLSGCEKAPPAPLTKEAAKILEMINNDDLPWTATRLNGYSTIHLEHIDINSAGYVYYDQNEHVEEHLRKYSSQFEEALRQRRERLRISRLDKAAIKGLQQRLKELEAIKEK